MFFTRGEIHKEMTNQETLGISKNCKNEFNEEEIKKKTMETKKR